MVLGASCASNTPATTTSASAAATSAAPTTTAAASTQTTGKVTTWKMQSLIPLTDPLPQIGSSFTTVLKSYVQWVNDMSNGQLVIELMEPGSVCPANAELAAVKSGVIDAAFTAPQFDEGKLGGITSIARGLPGVITTPQGIRNYFRLSGVTDVIQEAYATEGVYYIPALWSNDFSYLTNFQIQGIANFAGKKIRATGLDASVIKKAGGTPVTSISAGDLYMALQLGTVDGVAYGGASSLELSLNEVVKYYVASPNHYSCAGIIFNQDALAALPTNIKDNLVKYSPYILDSLTLDNNACEGKVAPIMEEKGITIVNFSEEETQKFRNVQKQVIADLTTQAESKGDTYYLKALQVLIDKGIYSK